MRQLYDDAHSLAGSTPGAALAERRTEYTDLFTQACRLGEQYALTYDHPCCTLAKRMLRHQDELFQFVLVPGLPADNNLAERSIRPLVIMRKISGGSRSTEGTKTRLTLASLFHTWAARHLNPFVECLAAATAAHRLRLALNSLTPTVNSYSWPSFLPSPRSVLYSGRSGA